MDLQETTESISEASRLGAIEAKTPPGPSGFSARKPKANGHAPSDPQNDDLGDLTSEALRLLEPLPKLWGKATAQGAYDDMPSDLSGDVVRASLAGDITIDIRPGDECSYSVFDVDVASEFFNVKITPAQRAKLKGVVLALQSQLELLGLKYFTEDSGRRGYHIWIFFDATVLVAAILAMLDWIARKVERPKEITVECKPSHARDGIRLFHNVHKMTGRRSEFVTRDLTPYNGTAVDFLRRVERNSGDEVREISESIVNAEKLKRRIGTTDGAKFTLAQLGQCAAYQKILEDAERGQVGHVARRILAMIVMPTGCSALKEELVELFAKQENFDRDTTEQQLAKMTFDRPVGCRKISNQLGACDGNCPAIQNMPFKSPAAFFERQEAAAPVVTVPGDVVPAPYSLLSSGVFETVNTAVGPITRRVAGTPMYVSSRTEDLDTSLYGVEITLHTSPTSPSKKLTVPLRTVMDASKILELTNHDMGVNSGNKDACVKYFDAQYAAAKDKLPLKYITRRTGWSTCLGAQCFILGRQVFTPQAMRDLRVEFLPGNGPGLAIAERTGAKGCREQWIQAMTKMLAFRFFVLALGAAFAGPILHLLDLGTLIFHFFRESSRGKTTLSMAAASVYGFPGDSRYRNSLIKQWRATDNGLEGLAFAHNDLVLPLDEAGQADPRVIEKSLYMLANGAAKYRATQDGEGRGVKNWALLILSNGEIPLLNGKATTGQEVRVVEFGKSPFDESDVDHRELVDEFQRTILENHGHAGATYLQELVEIVNDERRFANFKVSYDAKLRALLAHRNSTFHARNAKHFAAIWQALELADGLFRLFDTPGTVGTVVEGLYKESGEKWATDVTTVEKALRYLWDQIDAQAGRFEDLVLDRLGTRGDVLGFKQAFVFFEAKLDKLLADGQYDAKSVKAGLKERKFVILDAEGKLVQVRRDGKKQRAYAFHKDLVPHLFPNVTADDGPDAGAEHAARSGEEAHVLEDL